MRKNLKKKNSPYLHVNKFQRSALNLFSLYSFIAEATHHITLWSCTLYNIQNKKVHIFKYNGGVIKVLK